jgi:putative hydrolase of the HAD superfamily
MKIEAVVFDLDDTLTDWHGAASDALEEVAAAHGLSIEERCAVWEAMRQLVCVQRDGRVVERKHGRLADSHEPWLQVVGDGERRTRIVSAFRDALLPRLRMYQDFEVLSERRLRHRVAMLSNNLYAETALSVQGYLDLFEVVVMAEEPEGKPHAGAFNRAAAALRLDPESLVYVGDSIANDVEGALAAGWTPVWIDRFDDGYEIPDVERITTLRELPGLLARLEGL